MMFYAIFDVFVGLSVLQVFLRAMDLGFTRCAQPKRPGVAETLDAAEALLRTSGKAAARVLGAAMEAQPEMLGICVPKKVEIWDDKMRTMEAETDDDEIRRWYKMISNWLVLMYDVLFFLLLEWWVENETTWSSKMQRKDEKREFRRDGRTVLIVLIHVLLQGNCSIFSMQHNSCVKTRNCYALQRLILEHFMTVCRG